MKRIIVFAMLIAACGAAVCVRFYSNGLLVISPEGGVYSVFDGGRQIYYDKPPVWSDFSREAERWDFDGDIYRELELLGARTFKTETVCGVYVIYAYSPRLPKSALLDCGKVNIMAAVGSVNSIGYPLLCGSF